MNKERLKKIYEELKETFKDEKLSPRDFLDCTVRIYINEKISEEKAEIKLKPATDKQKKYLKRLGYEGEMKNLILKEASQLIEEASQLIEEASQLIEEASQLIEEYKKNQEKSAGYEY